MSAEHLATINDTSVMICAPEGLPIDTEGAATDLIGESLGQRASIVVIPSERLSDDFFELRTGVAGQIVQKFANYHLHLVIVGDVSQRVDDDEALRAWAAEANQGTQLWFCETFDELKQRLCA